MTYMRDIIYFDNERAQSFYAQLVNGLPTSQTRTTQRRHSGWLLGEFAIPLISKSQINVTHERSNGDATQYQSHDELLQHLINALITRRKLLQFTADQHSWAPDVLVDGKLYRLQDQ